MDGSCRGAPHLGVFTGKKKKKLPRGTGAQQAQAGQPGCAHITLSDLLSGHFCPPAACVPSRPAWSGAVKKSTPRWTLQRWKTLVLDRDQGLVGTGPLALHRQTLTLPAITRVVGGCPLPTVSTMSTLDLHNASAGSFPAWCSPSFYLSGFSF